MIDLVDGDEELTPYGIASAGHEDSRARQTYRRHGIAGSLVQVFGPVQGVYLDSGEFWSALPDPRFSMGDVAVTIGEPNLRLLEVSWQQKS